MKSTIAAAVSFIDMQRMSAEISKNVQVNDMKTSLKANGKTKQVAGKTAAGYDMEVSLPATFGGQKGMQVNVSMSGPLWIVKGGPGTPASTLLMSSGWASFHFAWSA